MSAEQIQFYFLLLVCIYFIVDTFLALLNLRFMQGHRQVPDQFSEVFDQESWLKAQQYTRAKTQLGILKSIFNLIVIFVIVLTGVLGGIDSWLRNYMAGEYLLGVLYIFSLSLISVLLSLPFSYYSTFVLEAKFDFNRSTYATWLLDILKSAVLSAVILTPLLLAIFWFMDTAGSSWWLYAWGFIAAFQLLLLFLYPVYIAPLFNSFKELETGSLKARLDQLADRLSFKTSGIYVMDGSKRSNHSNAYFTGYGKNKRIVLYDTLIENLSEVSLAAVLAHEIGHEKLNHIKKGIVLSLLMLGIGLFGLNLMLNYQPFYTAFGFEHFSYHAALVIFSVCSEPIMFFLGPLSAICSRRFEYEADRFAVDAMNDYRSLEQALLRLSRKSLANLTPHPLFSFFHYSHPTLSERFKAMEDYASNRV